MLFKFDRGALFPRSESEKLILLEGDLQFSPTTNLVRTDILITLLFTSETHLSQFFFSFFM